MWGERKGRSITVPEWFSKASEAIRDEILDKGYPCYFGTVAEKTGILFYTFVEDGDLSHLIETIPHFTRLFHADPRRRYTLAVLFEPDGEVLDADAYRQRTWDTFQYLFDHDPTPWPEDVPFDPDDPEWEFSFGGESFFVFAAAPSYDLRRSRRLGPCFCLFFQPRGTFFGIEAGTSAGTKARELIRQRLLAWDDTPVHPDLADYGDPTGREWKQIYLPDDDRPVAGACPLHVGARAIRERSARGGVTASRTLVDLICRRAAEHPERRAFLFLEDGEREGPTLTYGELDRQACSLGRRLLEEVEPGDRALLILPTGPQFVIAFLACLYSGVVAVPTYPVTPRRGLDRLRSLFESAEPRLVLSTEALLSRMEPVMQALPDLAAVRCLAVDDGETVAVTDGGDLPLPKPADIAFLQYTSGSTASPKGVMVSHGNLMRNEEAIRQAFGQSEESVVVGWLPLYHDMGLIGNVLQPLYVGATCVLMSPASFLQRPARWLEAINRYRATTSGGPNFAYDLCVQRIDEETRERLDLSCWRVAFDGAEPVRGETLERFAQTFQPQGFDHQAFYPCYGLAEATLFVTGGARRTPVTRVRFRAEALEQHRVEEVDDTDPDARTLVGCGSAWGQHRVLVVDPDRATALPPDRVGEIWVSGPSVAEGYWGRREDTDEVFSAVLADTGEGPFLRTGDLGFLRRGELFVTGRSKDLIILRGRNHYPQDLELTIEGSHGDLQPGCGAAFSVEVPGGERLVVVHELRRGATGDADEIGRAVRQALSEHHEVQLYDMVLVGRGGVPKTSSGKIRRRACRTAYLAGELEEMSRSRSARPSAESELVELPSAAALERLDADARRTALVAGVAGAAARALGVDPVELAGDQPLTAHGLDSLAAMDLKGRVEDRLGVVLPLSRLLDGATLDTLADELLDRLKRDEPQALPGPPVEVRPTPVGDFACSHGQRALWFLERLAPESAAYHIVSSLHLPTAVDLQALERALVRVVERHPSLRTVFLERDGQPRQRVVRRARLDIEVFDPDDVATWDEATWQARMAGSAYRPFDLETGPLVRLTVAPGSVGDSQHSVLLTVHHLVADFWSLTRIATELGLLYQEETSGPAAGLAEPEGSYDDFVRWQEALLDHPRGRDLWRFWRDELAGELPEPVLPFDRPRPPVQTHRGAARAMELPIHVAEGLEALAAERKGTLFTVLTAAFGALLGRYGGQEDLILGTPTAGRSRSAFAAQVGYFVNPVVLRIDLAGDPTFETLISRQHGTVTGALEHQEMPFALLAERLRPERDTSRSPLFQVMFIFQQTPAGGEPGLAELALGEPGARVRLGVLELEGFALERRVAQFDLTLTVARTAGGRLRAGLVFNTDLFDGSTVERLLEQLGTLVTAAAAAPSTRLSQLPTLSPERRSELLARFDDTRRSVGGPRTIHGQFAEQAERHPQEVALIFRDRELTYGELSERVATLARALAARGIGPGSRVGIAMERRPEMVTALLGVLAAGAAYVPLDPAYPSERLSLVAEDAGLDLTLTQYHLMSSLPAELCAACLALDRDWDEIAADAARGSAPTVDGDHLAYVLYTSGSTGRPKGVMVPHRAATNFFAGMDEAVGCGPDDTLLAVTSISFDISVLELFWTLARGAVVVLLEERAMAEAGVAPSRHPRRTAAVDLGLFYFASESADTPGAGKYDLLLEGARFADRHGFSAVWTPERHFHAFGGLYPNPVVTSAALATITDRITLRAGSVVLPLHDPVRVAEEWSVVDNLSHGRVGLAFASGWHADDFVFFPDRYVERKETMFQQIDTVRRLWRGESVERIGGSGETVELAILPRPLQAELPIWITAAGAPDTFERAGALGANVLTHLLGQTFEEVGEKVEIYRQARADAGHDPAEGVVSLMLHTFVDPDRDRVRDVVREPFTAYLRSSLGLVHRLVDRLDLDLDLDLGSMEERDLDDLLAFSFDRYFETSALFGTPADGLEVLDRVRQIGVDEVACLIDFGVEPATALRGLEQLADMIRPSTGGVADEDEQYSFAAQARRYRPTLFQATPSFVGMIAERQSLADTLGSLRALLVGGEALPPVLARRIGRELEVELVNVYGPTETTVWSATHRVEEPDTAWSVPIGRPIANTSIRLVGERGETVPLGGVGEVTIGGDGLAWGYLGQPALTAERFVPDPRARSAGGRRYRTGDLGQLTADERLRFVGRTDQQMKLRGHRIEPGEIERALGQHPAIAEAVVTLRPGPGGDRLVAYFVTVGDHDAPATDDLRVRLEERLPGYMVPQTYVCLDSIPRTPNRKVDRRALPEPVGDRRALGTDFVAPEGRLATSIAEIWAEILGLPRVGVRDNFFDLGGHSLMSAQLHSRLEQRLDIRIPLVKLLEHPTIESLVRYLEADGEHDFSADESRDRAARQRSVRGRRGRALRQARRTS